MKKPTKRDNTVVDKKAEKLNSYINELEDKFFKDVAEGDQEQLQIIKSRGGDSGEGNKDHHSGAPAQT